MPRVRTTLVFFQSNVSNVKIIIKHVVNFDKLVIGKQYHTLLFYYFLFITNTPMPMPAATTGIIHIEIDCAPAKSNAEESIWI